jgi:hypothetical protein
MTMKKVLLTSAIILGLSAPAHATALLGTCTTHAWDNFVQVRTLPLESGLVLWRLPNGISVALYDQRATTDGVWVWAEGNYQESDFKGWARLSSLNCGNFGRQ